MWAFHVVLFATFLSSAIDCAKNPTEAAGYRSKVDWDEVDKDITILAGEKSFKTTENIIRDALTTTKNLFGQPEVKAAIAVITKGGSKLPFVGELFSIVSTLSGFLAEETDWKNEFTKVIVDEMKKGHVNNDLENMNDVLHSIKNRLPLLNETVIDENEIPIKTLPEIVGFTTDIFSRLEEMVFSFGKPHSPYKRYPLIGAPFLIELGLLVVAFEPIAITLLKEASRYKLSCQTRDATFDYLAFVLDARFERTNLDLWKTKQIRKLPYNEAGYTEKDFLECGILPSGECSSYGEDACLIDQLSTKQYVKVTYSNPCEDSYGRHLRKLIENSFPLELLDELCDRQMADPTGKIH